MLPIRRSDPGRIGARPRRARRRSLGRLLGGVLAALAVALALYCGDAVSAAHAGTVLYAGRRSEGYLGFDGPPDAFYDLAAKRKLSTAAYPIVLGVGAANGDRT